MSPASKSKSKDKRAAGKEQQKIPSKALINANTGGGITTSGYNPLLGTFHTLETAPVSSAPPLHVNGRYRNIDETDDQNSFGGTGVEYDSVSNNGSWSGESEDQKDKNSLPPRQEAIIPGADSDKREKIRQKNERKHQRQKERRAQELHERCSGYLMSRKLEALAQQLVAMGFSSERATMALILNEGKLEESVAWLFEGAEEADNHNREHNLDGGGNLKIDISEELARIADMEIKFKCSKQDVERAIVACEGDLEQAADTLRVQKQDPPSVPPKPEETGDPPTSSGNSSKVPSVAPLTTQSSQRPHTKPTLSTGTTNILQKRDEKDFNYTKMAATVALSAEPGSKNMQLLKKIQPKLEWAKQQQIGVPSAAEKRWPVAGSNPSVSYSLASPLQASPPLAKTETRFATVGNELKNLQLGSVREPVVVMQRPQSKQMPTLSVSSSSSSSLSLAAADWHPNGVEPVVMNPNGLTHIPANSTRSYTSPTYASGTSNQLYDQIHFQQQQPQPQLQQYMSSSGPMDPGQPGTNQGNGLWNRTGSTSPTLAAASSLGLFSGLGSNGPSGPSSPVDWNAGGSMLLHLDYTNIDWSLDRAPSSLRPSVMWQGISSSMQHGNTDSFAATSGRNVKTTLRPVLSNGNNGVSMSGLQDGVAASETSAGGSREWTSPFEEKDLFSFPRQFVSSPSL